MRGRLSLWLGLLPLLLLVAAAGPAFGQESEKKRERRSSGHTVSPMAYKALMAAQEALQAEQLAAAREALDELRSKEGRLNAHERALLYQTYGYLEAGESRYEKATDYLAKCLAEDALPESARLQTLYNLAQLYVATERYPDATKTLIEWLRASGDPAPAVLYMLAVAYYQQGELTKAIRPASLAVRKAESPKESWLQLLLSLRLERKEYDKARPVLEQLTELYPKKSYWLQLSALYGELDREKDSLAALELAYTQGLLDEDEELRRLAQLYLYHEIPYRAARLVKKGLDEGRIEPDPEAYELLASAWMRAREFEKAIGPLEIAARGSDDGKLYLRLGQAYVEREDWGPAAAALERALAKGGLESPGRAHLLLGVASFNQKKLATARSAFTRAARNEKTREDAERWLRHLEKAGGDVEGG